MQSFKQRELTKKVEEKVAQESSELQAQYQAAQEERRKKKQEAIEEMRKRKKEESERIRKERLEKEESRLVSERCLGLIFERFAIFLMWMIIIIIIAAVVDSEWILWEASQLDFQLSSNYHLSTSRVQALEPYNRHNSFTWKAKGQPSCSKSH